MTYKEYEKIIMDFLIKMEKPGISLKVIQSIKKEMQEFENNHPEFAQKKPD